MSPRSVASVGQLQKALAVAKQIEKLQSELGELLGGQGFSIGGPKPRPGIGRPMSAATIAKMKASPQARWAKKKGPAPITAEVPAAKAPKKKRKLSPEGRARIVSALKARHAAKKAAVK
jgi:hypothetical protein